MVKRHEAFSHLAAEEKVKRLRELEDVRRKDLDKQKQALLEMQKSVEKEIAEAEEEIKETVDEVQQEAEQELQKHQGEREEDLEERLANAPKTPESVGKSYDAGPSTLYRTLERDINELNRLYEKTVWDERDQSLYREAKEHVDRAGQYHLRSDQLLGELSEAKGTLHRLQYRR